MSPWSLKDLQNPLHQQDLNTCINCCASTPLRSKVFLGDAHNLKGSTRDLRGVSSTNLVLKIAFAVIAHYESYENSLCLRTKKHNHARIVFPRRFLTTRSSFIKGQDGSPSKCILKAALTTLLIQHSICGQPQDNGLGYADC